ANLGLKSLAYIREKSKNRTILDRLKYKLDGNISLQKNNSQRNSNAQIENHLNPKTDYYIDREYSNDSHIHRQQLIFTVTNHNDKLRVINLIDFHYSKTNQHVNDLDGSTAINDTALTHESNLRQLTYTPKIEYSYFFIERDYVGRFSEQLSLKPAVALRLLNRQNTSTLDYRNIEQRLVSYLPHLDVEYQYNKYGIYLFSSRLGYIYSEKLPSLHQLQPIYDNINPAYRYFGNPRLSETHTQTLSGSFRFQEHKPQSLMINFNTSYNIIDSGIRDSIVFATGQQQ